MIMNSQPQPRPRIPDDMLADHQLWIQSGQQRGKPIQLAGLDLTGIEISGLELSDAAFGASILRHAQAVGTRLPYALLQGADLSYAILTLANLVKAQMDDAKFDGATLAGANLARANAYATSFQRADLRGARLFALSTGLGTSFKGADLRDADLTDMRLNGVDFTDVDLRGAKGIDTIRRAENVTVGDQVLSGAAFIEWAQQEAARP